MKHVFAFLLIAGAAGLAFWFWRAYQQLCRTQPRLGPALRERHDAGHDDRAASRAGPSAAMAQQKLLYEAASKAGEAGEAVLSIQLYARLLARYPDSTLGTQARAAVEAQKKKLTKP